MTEITRETLRDLRVGQSIVQTCKDGYDLHSKRSNAYQLAACEGITLRCVKSGDWTLTITRTA
ncbi:MAG: hypothetical protein LUD72_10475 [Bacteroidales bacterium]|nr:hypothetical protein [Bacteroidales bacterium]